MKIELLVVPDCPHESAADRLITLALADTGVTATITRTVIATLDAARERHFVGSPTILLNGYDAFLTGNESVGLVCRLYPTPQGIQGIPQLRDLLEALKRAAVETSKASRESARYDCAGSGTRRRRRRRHRGRPTDSH